MSSNAKASAYEVVRSARAFFNNLLDRRWDDYPYGRHPLATKEEYLRLFQQAREKIHAEVEALEVSTGFAVDQAWFHELALHTQIVKKSSELDYSHGRILYSLLRNCIEKNAHSHVVVLETGTARGFSAICMAKAMADSNVSGQIVTLDVLPHLKQQIWNCIDDLERPKSRAELLHPWSALTRSITFLQGDTVYLAPRVGLERINFAFLDAQHIKSSVLSELAAVVPYQTTGDMVFFDDVTPAIFPGVVDAVAHLEAAGTYRVTRFQESRSRGYAWATKL